MRAGDKVAPNKMLPGTKINPKHNNIVGNRFYFFLLPSRASGVKSLKENFVLSYLCKWCTYVELIRRSTGHTRSNSAGIEREGEADQKVNALVKAICQMAPSLRTARRSRCLLGRSETQGPGKVGPGQVQGHLLQRC